MFDWLLKKKDTENADTQTVTFAIQGLHCTSCSLNIDGALEETKGVVSAATSYRTSETTIVFDPNFVSEGELSLVITGLGYTVVPVAK